MLFRLKVVHSAYISSLRESRHRCLVHLRLAGTHTTGDDPHERQFLEESPDSMSTLFQITPKMYTFTRRKELRQLSKVQFGLRL